MSVPPDSSSASGRVQLIVAVIGALGLVAVAVVTGAFGLFADSHGRPGAATRLSANGGSSKAVGTCISGGVVVEGGTVNCASSARSGDGLRIALRQTGLQLYDVAFDRDIGVPPDGTTWQTLHDEGGIDVYDSTTRMTLANRSSEPISITDIHVEVIGTEAPPRASEAYVYTQGDEALKQFAVPIKSDTGGATAAFYRVDHSGVPSYLTGSPDPPFFQEHTISLRPGEIYEAAITVQTLVRDARTIDYRFVIKGSTADQPFERATEAQRVSSYIGSNDHGPGYAHHYVRGYLSWAKSMGWCPDVPLHEWSTTPTGTAKCP